MLSDIAGLYSQRIRKLPLDGEVPLVGNRGPIVRIGRVQAHAGKARRGRRSHILDRASAGGAQRTPKFAVSGELMRQSSWTNAPIALLRCPTVPANPRP